MNKVVGNLIKRKTNMSTQINYPVPYSSFYTDTATGKPIGGTTTATGLQISWQAGMVVDSMPNGAFVETVIEAAESRLNFYQSTKFNCAENAEALKYLALAKEALINRTKVREALGVANSHNTHDAEQVKKLPHSDHEQNFGA